MAAKFTQPAINNCQWASQLDRTKWNQRCVF